MVTALAAVRQKRGVSQRELSTRLDLHPMTIMQIENGGRNLTLVEFFDIARALETDPIEMLRGVFGG